jgi:hypothetical protein
MMNWEESDLGILSFIVSQLTWRGRATTQAASRWLPTAAARVRCQVRPYGIRGGQRGNEAGFLRVLRFPLQILSPLNSPYSSII